MMALLTTFFVAMGLSLVGSLPPGVINMTAAMISLNKGWWPAVFFSIGAAMIEWLQAFVSLKFSYLLTLNPNIDFIFQIISSIVFSGLAVYFLFFAPKTVPKLRGQEGSSKDFFQGMAISLTNVMVFPYWIFYGAYLNSNGWLGAANLDYSVFSTGVAAGAFLVFLLFAKLAQAIFNRLENVVRSANQIVGSIFLFLAIFQLSKLLIF